MVQRNAEVGGVGCARLSRFVLVSGAGVVEDVVGQRDHEWNVLETGVTERFLWFNLR